MRLRLLLLLVYMTASCAPADSQDAPGEGETSGAGARLAAAGLPVGEYRCHDTYTEIGSGTRISYKELLIVEDGQTYRYRQDGPTGEYAYDSASGEVQWLSGPYAGGSPTGRFERKPDSREVITLSYTFDRLGSDDDFCIRTGAPPQPS